MTSSPGAMAPVATTATDRIRVRIRVRGVVQGVGYRPFVHRAATEGALAGHVGNDTDGVFLEVEGSAAAVEAFETRLRGEAPPLARVEAVESWPMAALGEKGFRIVESRADSAVRTFVAPDAALCRDCLRELFDPLDRRYRYPFITCTNCGPRFTITKRLPYDRPNTTMAGFPLCPACSAQYHDPQDRRFHAQPLACAVCGPRLWLERPGSQSQSGPADVHRIEGTDAAVAAAHRIEGTDVAVAADHRIEGTDAALAAAQRALAEGLIVAVKGLGGYHIACDAGSDAAVARLRGRKGRADKPFAVMARDLDTAHRLAHIDADEARLLLSPQQPIVLLAVRDDAVGISARVAPDNPMIGIMLPYTPLHHLLFQPVPGADQPSPEVLVMTSGNITDEPICYDDDDARRRLGRLADCWLVHDRPIHVPCDDSVVRLVDGQELPVRRSRGYAPLPVRLPLEVAPVLAVGGELKNTFCLASGHDAWMSQHIGDMGSPETLAAFERSTGQFRDIYQVVPERLAADLHPGYHTRNWAEEHTGTRGAEGAEGADGADGADGATSTDHVELPLALVQHHHAHVAAVMAEHSVPPTDQVIGFAFDGTGYGPDGAIWGGEVLLATYHRYTRVAHLGYVPLPGGDATIKRPYRAALAHLRAAGIEWSDDLAPVRATDPTELRALRRQLERDVQCVPTSSMGRLFDAVSSLLGVRHQVSYEAQAAIELETQAAAHLAVPATYHFRREGDVIDPGSVLRAIVEDLRAGAAPGAVAAGFHVAVAQVVGELATEIGGPIGVSRAALSGGVFQNVLLLRLTGAELRGRGFDVLTHRIVPPNDGGLALGQAIVAGATAASMA